MLLVTGYADICSLPRIGTAGIEPALWLFPCFFCQDRSYRVKATLLKSVLLPITRPLREGSQCPTFRNAPYPQRCTLLLRMPDQRIFRFLTRLTFRVSTGGGFVLLFVLTDSTGEHLSRFRHRSNSLRENCKLTWFNEEKAPRLMRVRICTLLIFQKCLDETVQNLNILYLIYYLFH